MGIGNGLFSWTANTVGTNTFTIRATDNGSPSLSDTQMFDVVVMAQLQITGIAVSNNSVTLNWRALPGRSYNVEYKDSLVDGNWNPLIMNITTTSNAAFVNDAGVANMQRIYRIVLRP